MRNESNGETATGLASRDEGGGLNANFLCDHFFFIQFFFLNFHAKMLIPNALAIVDYYRLHFSSGFHIKTVEISQPFRHINCLLNRCKCVNSAESSLENLI